MALNPAKFDILIQRFLESLLKEKYSDEILTTTDLTYLKNAIKFYDGLCGEFLNLEAIASGEEETRNLHQKEEKLFFELLKKSLKIEQTEKTFAITGFDEKVAALNWLGEKPKIDLRVIHADIRNLAVAEKFLSGKLHGQEWLSEVDQSRLLKIYGLNNRVFVTRRTSQDMGMILHFEKAKHPTNKPYQIPFLINVGSSGDVSSQGIHWAEVIFTIDPVNSKISISYKDSMRLGSLEKARIEEELRQAVKYSERSEVNKIVKIYQAFPNFTIEKIEIKDGKDLQEEQKAPAVAQSDAWSCGYRALKNLVNDLDVSQEIQDSPSLKSLKEMKPQDATSENLRNCMYEDLLGALAVDESSLEKYAKQEFPRAALEEPSTKETVEEVMEGIDAKPKKIGIDRAYLKDYVAYIGQVKPNRTVVKSTPGELKNLLEIEKKTREFYVQFKEKLQSTSEEIKTERGTLLRLTLDLKEFIQKDETEIDAIAKFRALVKIINESQVKGVVNYQLVINNSDLISEKEQKNFLKIHDVVKQEFNKLVFIKTFKLDNKKHPLNAALESLAARNRFFDVLKIRVNTDEDIWTQFWQQRISNGALLLDKLYLMGELALSSSANHKITLPSYQEPVEEGEMEEHESSKKPKINFWSLTETYILSLGDIYVNELFKYILNHREFFEENGFPYTVLTLGTQLSPNDAGPNPYAKEYSKLNTAYLDSLLEHFEKGDYFPFKKLTIYLNAFAPDNFAKVKQLIELLGENYPHMEAITLYVTDDHMRLQDFTKEQYKELQELFQAKKLTLNLAINFQNSHHQKTEQFGEWVQLNNIIAINQRNFRIEQRGKKKPTLEAATKDPKSPAVSVPSKKSGKVRPYKLSKVDAQPEVTVAVEAEVGVEEETQYSRQTQLEQEAMQEIQVQQQQTNEIASYSNEMEASASLIDRQKYLKDVAIASEAMMGLSNQCPKVIDTGLVDMTPKGFLRFNWESAFGSASMPNSIQLATPNAMNKIRAFPNAFLGGINIDNLPTGFYVQEVEKKLVLCFDETKFIENKNASPLTIKITSNIPPYWTGDLRVFLPDAKPPVYSEKDPLDSEKDISSVDAMDNFDKHPTATFLGVFSTRDSVMTRQPDYPRCTLTLLKRFMSGVDQEQADYIIKTHGWFLNPENEFDEDSINGKGIFNLMDILFFEGCFGVNQLLTTLKILHDKDPELYENFKENFLDGEKSIRPLLEQDNLELIQKLANMTPIQKQWWKQLITQHKTLDSQNSLAELYKGFMYFMERLPKEIPCPIENSRNMLSDLDRLLAILGRVKPRNLLDQMENLKGLSFDQEGAWYAARWEDFHYFHPAMALTPEEIDVDFEAKFRDGRKTYKVEYNDLKLLSNVDLSQQTIDYPIVLFHRYLGGADQIIDRYQYYVDLTNQLKNETFSIALKAKLLPLLASATTGERGCTSSDPTPLFEYIRQNQNTITPYLEKLITSIPNWEVKPTLDELGAVLQFLHESGSPDNIKQFEKDISVKVLKAIAIWQKNSEHLPTRDYLTIYDALKDFDPMNIGLLAKIAALIRAPYDEDQKKALIESLELIKTNSTYSDILIKLSSIDLENTPHDQLPTLDELNEAIKAVEGKPANAILVTLKMKLPNCTFDIAQNLEGPPLDLTASMIEKVEELNSYLMDNNIMVQFESDKMQGEMAVEYVSKKLNEVNSAAQKELGIGWNFATKKIAYGKIIEALEGVLFVNMAMSVQQFPELYALQTEADLFPKPTLSGDYAKISEDYKQLGEYANAMDKLYESLIKLRRKWGGNFDIKFLLNSSRTRQFSQGQIREILDAIHEINSSYVPAQLLQTIFSEVPFAKGTNMTQVKDAIIFAVSLKQFNLVQRTSLVEILIKVPEFSEEIVQKLTKLQQLTDEKKQHPLVVTAAFQLIKAYYEKDENQANKEILTDIDTMLALIGEDEVLKKIIFSRLSDKPDQFHQFVKKLGQIFDKSDQVTFLKIITYACLEREEDAENLKEIFGLEGDSENSIIEKLRKVFVDSPVDFDNLKTLFNERPYPKLPKLQQFLSLHENYVRQVMEAIALPQNNKIEKKVRKDKLDGLLEKISQEQILSKADIEIIEKLSKNKKLSKKEEEALNKIADTEENRKINRVKHFFETYQMDPPGLRAINTSREARNLDAQFDMSTAHTRIDQIQNLARNSQSLFYGERKQLLDAVTYVNEVGRTHYLQIPGMAAEQAKNYQTTNENKVRAVKDLTKLEISELIKHYRKVISGKGEFVPPLTPEQILLAKLEFVALANEAMYRASGKFPYSTQTISLLNVVLHGGNIFSEIRTGEGKGCITALFAASQLVTACIKFCISDKILPLDKSFFIVSA